MQPEQDRLTPENFAELCDLLTSEGLAMGDKKAAEQRLAELREMYEPYLYSLSKYFLVSLPPWVMKTKHPDNWQTSPWREEEVSRRWKRRSRIREDHF
jgi:hypothetical protein